MRSGEDWLWRCWSCARPHQTSAILIGHGVLGVEEFFLERFNRLVIQMELEFERPVRDPATLAEQGKNLIQHRVKVHD